MGGFHLDQEEGAATAGGRKKEGEDSSWSPNPHIQAQHRRSKSSSDRNIDGSRDGVLHRTKKGQNELHVEASPLSTRAYRTRSPLHDSFAYSNKNTPLNQRASLEKDVSLEDRTAAITFATRKNYATYARESNGEGFKHVISRAQALCHTDKGIDCGDRVTRGRGCKL